MVSFRRRPIAQVPVVAPPPSLPPGRRVYAIGDVHGRLDLLHRAVDAALVDVATDPIERVYLVFLGDLIDRGPASREILELLSTRDWGGVIPVFLLGNHEEAMLAAYDGNRRLLRDWMGFGGAETAESYGVPSVLLLRDDWQGYWQALRAAVPADHVEFLRGFYDRFELGDYLFVHAGIRPGVPIEDQDPRDLRWIRDEFLLSRESHGKVVVHGHTVADRPELLHNRIGIDTGAYRTGLLTLLRLQDAEQRVMIIGHDAAASPSLAWDHQLD